MPVSAKDAILARIRQALADAPPAEPITRDYHQHDDRAHAALLEEFIDRLRDYKAVVYPITNAALAPTIAEICATHGIRSLAVPTDLPPAWLPDGIEVLRDAPPLSLEQLDHADGVLTGCELAIASTGTIVLVSGATQGRRALSLVPDRHLCVVRAEQVVGVVPEAIARLASQATNPMTFIAGPSATSDIELSRVEGVHGPRTLLVILVSQ